MKNERLIGIGCVIGIGCLALSGCPLDVVYFPDAGLDKAVRESLEKPFGFITRADLIGLREIQAAGSEIRNLEGLQYCTALTHLNLRSNRIQSITELTNLNTLVWLDLGDNILTDIEPLSGLLELQFLNLFGADQQIWDWQHLVANVTADGSALGDGGVVLLPTNTTLESDGTPQESFQEFLSSLQSANVQLIFADPGDEVQL